MATEVKLPALGESVTEGTVTQWLKAVGDNVAVDEPLLEVSTDKVDTEIPSPVAGTLLEIRAAEDETVEIGAVLAIVGEQGESTPANNRTAGRMRLSRPSRRRSLSNRNRRGCKNHRQGHASHGRKSPSRRSPSPRRLPLRRVPRRARKQVAASPVARIRWRRRHGGHAPGARRERHRGHRHPVAQGRRRQRRRRRAAAGSLDRQGRHRDPLPRRRHAARDPGRRRRDRRDRRRAGNRRVGRAVVGRPRARCPARARASAQPEPSRSPSRRRQPEPPAAEQAQTPATDRAGRSGHHRARRSSVVERAAPTTAAT